MGNWVRQNLVLVAGIVLPVLLVIGFLALEKIPGALAEPPGYDFLVVAYRYDNVHPREFQLSFEVRDGRLIGQVTPRGDGNAPPNRQHASIFRYRAAENAFEEIPFELPGGLGDLDETITFEVDATGDLRLDKAKRSPDGYLLEYLGYRGRGGLLGELFGMGRRHDSYYVLSRNDVHFDLPGLAAGPYYYGHDLHFLGWVVGTTGAS